MSVPIGPYTPIVKAGPWLICSGQLGIRSDGAADAPPTLVEGGAPAQISQALANAGRLLRGQGATPEDVVKTTVFVTGSDDFAPVNQAYVAFFGGHRPARSMVAVAALPMGALVEVELWAYQAPPSPE
jgi:2-iminobutanoate/2-iminopropanoate deaminase